MLDFPPPEHQSEILREVKKHRLEKIALLVAILGIIVTVLIALLKK